MPPKGNSNYIALVDSGIANIGSVYKALEKAGRKAIVTHEANVIKKAAGVVFPGVGSFAYAMMILQKNGLVQILRETIESGKPFLGICLGLQLLFSSSEECSECETKVIPGLNIIPGEVKLLPAGQPVPHVGWNRVYLQQKGHPLFKGLPEDPYFYFTHSYYVQPLEPQVRLALTFYGSQFTSAVAHGNLMGVQFHPEKSGPEGLLLLRNFDNMVFIHR